jgi:SagB-type dehydrogenase family enzyme
MDKNSGDRFHQSTKYHRDKLVGNRLDWDNKPEAYKEYLHSKRINLGHPTVKLDKSLNTILQKRRSTRIFSNEPISKENLSYLLWASTGIQRNQNGHEFRTAPSAGALYPIETYLIVNNVENVDRGVYHYCIKEHYLEELKSGDFRNEITKAALDQNMCADAAVVFIWTAIFNRSKWKYDQRAYRYIYLDAGHIAQNLALASTGLNLGSCQIAALFDDEINEIINVDGIKESTIYMSVVGCINKEE